LSKGVHIRTSALDSVTQELLFALAYWLTTADHCIQESELEWLHDQFGKPFVAGMMARLSAMKPTELTGHVRELHRNVPPGELTGVQTHLLPWLLELATVDEQRAVNETVVLSIVSRLLGVESVSRRKSQHRCSKPFAGWPNPLSTTSRSSFEIG
jgi:hypothetical protein